MTYMMHYLSCDITAFYIGHDIRGYKINVAMAEKSAPRAPQSYGHGYQSLLLVYYHAIVLYL